MSIRRTTYLCAGIVAVVAAGYHALLLSGRAASAGRPTELAVPLDQFPAELGRWVGRDIRLSDDIVQNAGADAHLRRDYADGRGGTAALYIAYYGDVKDTVPHGPTICYPSAGWATTRSEVLTLPTEVPGFEELQVQKLLYEKDFTQVAVLYWYAANGEQQIETQSLRFDAARRKLLGLGGAYVSQVMVSTPVQASEERAFALLEEFFRRNFDAIAKHFPQPSLDVEGQANAPAE